MEKRTYQELMKTNFGTKDYGERKAGMAQKFVKKLRAKKVPLSRININSFRDSIPAVYIDTPYPDRRQKKLYRFSERDLKSAVKFSKSRRLR